MKYIKPEQIINKNSKITFKAIQSTGPRPLKHDKKTTFPSNLDMTWQKKAIKKTKNAANFARKLIKYSNKELKKELTIVSSQGQTSKSHLIRCRLLGL